MPNTTVHGGPSYKPNEVPEGLAEPAAAEDAAEQPAGSEYDDLSKQELQDLLDDRGLPVSGNKVDLVQRLKDADAEVATGASESGGQDTSGEEG